MKTFYITLLSALIALSSSAQWDITFDNQKSDISGHWTLSKKVGESITIEGTMPNENLSSAWIDIILVNVDDWSTIEEVNLINIDLSGKIYETIMIPAKTKSTFNFENDSYLYLVRVVGEYGGSSWQNRIAALNVLPAEGIPGNIAISFNGKNQGMRHNESLPLKKQLPGSKISLEYEFSAAHYGAKPTKVVAKLMQVNSSWVTVGKPLLIESAAVSSTETKGELTVTLPSDITPSNKLPETDFYILQALVYYGKVPLFSIIKLSIDAPGTQQ